MEKLLEKLLKESIKSDNAFISIKKGNKAEINAKGSDSGLLIALVTLENHILNELNISEEFYLIFKSLIGSK